MKPCEICGRGPERCLCYRPRDEALVKCRECGREAVISWMQGHEQPHSPHFIEYWTCKRGGCADVRV